LPGTELPADLPHDLGGLPALPPARGHRTREAVEQLSFDGLLPFALGGTRGRPCQLRGAPGQFFVLAVDLSLQCVGYQLLGVGRG